MGIANRLTDLMKKNSTNANELACKAGIPASTIYSLIRRDSNRVDIDSLIKIAKALNVTADYLLETGFEEHNILEVPPRLQKIISCYNAMTEDGQRLLARQAEFFLNEFRKNCGSDT